MEETPETPGPELADEHEPRAYRAADKALAGVLLVGVLALGFVCLDVLAGGRIVRALAGPAPEGDA